MNNLWSLFSCFQVTRIQIIQSFIVSDLIWTSKLKRFLSKFLGISGGIIVIFFNVMSFIYLRFCNLILKYATTLTFDYIETTTKQHKICTFECGAPASDGRRPVVRKIASGQIIHFKNNSHNYSESMLD